MSTPYKLLFFLVCTGLLNNVDASNASLTQQRKNFRAAEKLIKRKNSDEFFKQLSGLKDYPLYPYLYYQWLARNLNQDKKIVQFINDQHNNRYASLLRNKWLLHLGKKKHWTLFLKHYKPTTNVELQCYLYRAKFQHGQQSDALIASKLLWTSDKSQPSACDPLFKKLKQSKYFTAEMVWQRFYSVMKNRNIRLAKFLLKDMSKSDRKIAETWLKVDHNPRLIKDNKIMARAKQQKGLMFAHGIDRLASKNLKFAIKWWDQKNNHYKIDSNTRNRIEQRLAMSLAYRRDKDAYQRLSQLKKPDISAQEWRVRTALRIEDWPKVEASIDAMNKVSQEKERWQYWLARALEKNGHPDVAAFKFKNLAKTRSYYGYLSADKLQSDYELEDDPVKVTDAVYQRFKQQTDYQVVAELDALKKHSEARRQWWYAFYKLDKKKKPIAAKYAQELGWTQTAIFTLARAKYWDDIGIRFPIEYSKQVNSNARLRKLDPAIIYALIRRESAFNANARSHVGATGLMQIMPKTGKGIARQLKQRWQGKKQLLQPATNIKFGSYYYKKLLNQFNGHYALAAAGYNAGPHRVKKWRPKNKSMDADIWIETITFKETREYVAAVLTYALIYQKKLNQNQFKLSDLLTPVKP